MMVLSILLHLILFVRRRESGSELDKQRTQKRIVRSSDLLKLSQFRNIDINNIITNEKKGIYKAIKKVSRKILKVFKTNSLLTRALRKVSKGSAVLKNIRQKQIYKHYPDWLLAEWKSIHVIEKEIFPSNDILCGINQYDAERNNFGLFYKEFADATRYDKYDYIIFVPYINRGGADLVALKYANSVARQAVNKKICVIATEEIDSEWSSRLDKSIDFVSFGKITQGISNDAKMTILARILTNVGPKCIHIINSAIMYDFVKMYNQYLSSNNIKVIVCAFCEDRLSDGHIMGYIHTLLPKIYEYTDKILSDNETIIKSLCDEYGYDAGKFSCHYIAIDDNSKYKKSYKNSQKLLWASRIAFQKQPELISKISKILYKKMPGISIDVYGSFDKNISKSIFKGLKNVNYKGPFNGGLYSLPLDEYDAFLYTSLFDGMPNIILEAANAKIPIITSGVGGIKELCKQNKTAFVINEAENEKEYVDRIIEFYTTSIKTRIDMTDKAYKLVTNLHNENHFEKDVNKDIICYL